MWNKRRDEEPPKPIVPPRVVPAPPAAYSPSPAVPHPGEVKKEATTVTSTPVRTSEPESRAGAATIGKSVKVVGQIFSKEDLYVDGTVEGTIEALDHKLIIGPHGTVHAAIKAREVLAQGTVQGNVDAVERIEIRKDARLTGDMRTARIIIEDGAYFKGSIDIVKPEPAKVAPKPPAPAAAPATVTPVVSPSPVGASSTENKR
jgi:cytoskeletal protein CcmA (bactofilin family)